MKSVEDLGDLRGKRVLIRCDFNVPLDGDVITDDGRIKAALPTLGYLREQGAKIVIMAHLGRPKGQVNPDYSLGPVAKRLGELLGAEVKLAADVVGPSATATVAALGEGEVALLENVRYEPAEESKVDAEREALAKAVTYLDAKMAEIKKSGKVAGTERIAVTAALNMAHELLSLRLGEGFDVGEARRRIGDIEAKLEAALAKQEKLF